MTNYNEIAPAYLSENRMNHPMRQAIYDLWRSQVHWRNLRVLDLGCGDGSNAETILHCGAGYVFGVDVSGEMIERAKKRNLSSRIAGFLVADLTSIQLWRCLSHIFGEEKFGLAIAILSMHYSSTRRKLGTFIRNVSQCLCEKGSFLGLIIDPDNPIMDYSLASHIWVDEPFKEGSRIKTTLFGVDGTPMCDLFTYHWARKTYTDFFKRQGFKRICWEKKGVLANTSLVMISATK